MACLILNKPGISFFSRNKRLFNKKSTQQVAPSHDKSKPTLTRSTGTRLFDQSSIIDDHKEKVHSGLSHSTNTDSSDNLVNDRLNESLGLDLPITSDIAYSNGKRRKVRFADEKKKKGLTTSSNNSLVTSISYRPITSKKDANQLYYTELDYARFTLREYHRIERDIAIHGKRKDIGLIRLML